jgi:hypothetical protein
MAKVNQTAMWLLVHRPLEIEIYGGRSYPLEEILLCAYQATNYNYYRFQVQGLNVVLVSTSLLSFTRVSCVVSCVSCRVCRVCRVRVSARLMRD